MNNEKEEVYKPHIELGKTYIRKEAEDFSDDEDILLMNILHHSDDVGLCLRNIGSYLEDIGDWHDWTKIEYFEEFKKDVFERLNTPEFKERDWYNIHTELERHHINANAPCDVNLFDVLEMMVDCIVAGKSRSGSVNDSFLVLPQSILNNAYWNTVKLLKDSIILKDDED